VSHEHLLQQPAFEGLGVAVCFTTNDAKGHHGKMQLRKDPETAGVSSNKRGLNAQSKTASFTAR
jgi:hypothetical protein